MCMNIVSRAQAKKNGQTHYFTGRPCKRGHVARRYVSNQICEECDKLKRKKRDKRYYEKNKDKIKDRVSQWVSDNKDKRTEYERQYYQENKTELKQNAKDNYQENKTERRAQQSVYRDANKDRINKRNMVNVRKRQAQKLNATPKWYEHDAMVELYENSIDTHIHHIIPLLDCKDVVCGLHCFDNVIELSVELHNKLHSDIALLQASWEWTKTEFVDKLTAWK